MTPLEREFTKFLKYLKLDQGPNKITSLSKEDLEGYGTEVIDGIDFDGYRIIKYKHKYEYKTLAETRFREGFSHEVYVTVTTEGDRETPPDAEEVYLFGAEYSSKTFLEILNHMNEARLTDELMCEGMAPQHPYVVNYILNGVRGQFPCEVQDTQTALELCSDTYPGCEVENILIQGED